MCPDYPQYVVAYVIHVVSVCVGEMSPTSSPCDLLARHTDTQGCVHLTAQCSLDEISGLTATRTSVCCVSVTLQDISHITQQVLDDSVLLFSLFSLYGRTVSVVWALLLY